MGRRGPAPTPIAILEARGSWRAKLNKDEMKPKQGAPTPPASLKGEARYEWKRIVKELSPSRVLTKADRAILVLYCQHWESIQRAAKNIQKDGDVIELPNGYPGPNPWNKVRNESTRICMRLLAELGCSPSGRARIPAPPEEEKDEGLDLDE